MKIEQAGSAGEFATTLDRTAEQLIYWRAKIATIEIARSGTANEFADSLNKVSEVGKRMSDVSEAKTQTSVSTFSAVLYAALERFDSDAEVQQAMQKLMRTLNPNDSSDGIAEAPPPPRNEKSKFVKPESTDSLLDRKTIETYFGENGFFPNLGDSLQEVATRLGVKIIDHGNHSSVTSSDNRRIRRSDYCQFTVVGTNGAVEGIAVYPYLGMKVPESKEWPKVVDVRPLAISLRDALSPIVLKHASQDLVEVWASNDDGIGIALRTFKPKYSNGGQISQEYRTLSYGTQKGLKVIMDNEYHCSEHGNLK